MKKLSKGRNRSLIKDFTSGTSLIKDSGRLDTSTFSTMFHSCRLVEAFLVRRNKSGTQTAYMQDQDLAERPVEHQV